MSKGKKSGNSRVQERLMSQKVRDTMNTLKNKGERKVNSSEKDK